MDSRIRVGTGAPTHKAAEGALYLDGSTDTVYKQTAAPSGNTWLSLSTESTKRPVRLATIAALPAHTQTDSGVGMRLTASANGALSVDGIAVTTDDRILNKNHTTRNGLFKVIQPGSVSTPWILERTADFDDSTDVFGGLIIIVKSGSTLANTVWYLSTNDPIVVDTTTLTFQPFVQQLKIIGTANQVTVTNTTTGIQLSTPQNLDTGANVTFGSVAATSVSATNISGTNINGTNIFAETSLQLGHFEYEAGSDTDDADFGQHSYVRFRVNAPSIKLTGVKNAQQCQILVIENSSESVGTLHICHDTTSSDENRFWMQNHRPLNLRPGESAIFVASKAQNRWIATRCAAPYTIKSDYTDIANTTGGEDDLNLVNLEQNFLSREGDALEITAAFNLATGGGSLIRLWFGGDRTEVLNTGIACNGPMFVKALLQRVANDTVRAIITRTDGFGVTQPVTIYDYSGFDIANNAYDLKFTGQASPGEITQKQFHVVCHPTPIQ